MIIVFAIKRVNTMLIFRREGTKNYSVKLVLTWTWAYQFERWKSCRQVCDVAALDVLAYYWQLLEFLWQNLMLLSQSKHLENQTFAQLSAELVVDVVVFVVREIRVFSDP